MSIYKGKILRISGSWGSGLALLDMIDERLGRVRIPCDNGQTVRALDECFGGVIGPGHTINSGAVAGKEIFYAVNEFGILALFAPVEGATPELVEEYEAEKKKPRQPGNRHIGFLPPDDPIYNGGPIVAGREILKKPGRTIH
jgi:hypothetical protein